MTWYEPLNAHSRRGSSMRKTVVKADRKSAAVQAVIKSLGKKYIKEHQCHTFDAREHA